MKSEKKALFSLFTVLVLAMACIGLSSHETTDAVDQDNGQGGLDLPDQWSCNYDTSSGKYIVTRGDEELCRYGLTIVDGKVASVSFDEGATKKVVRIPEAETKLGFNPESFKDSGIVILDVTNANLTDDTFEGWTELTEVHLTAQIQIGAKWTNNSTEVTEADAPKFKDCAKLEYVYFSNGSTSTGIANASGQTKVSPTIFSGCSNLKLMVWESEEQLNFGKNSFTDSEDQLKILYTGTFSLDKQDSKFMFERNTEAKIALYISGGIGNYYSPAFNKAPNVEVNIYLDSGETYAKAVEVFKKNSSNTNSVKSVSYFNKNFEGNYEGFVVNKNGKTVAYLGELEETLTAGSDVKELTSDIWSARKNTETDVVKNVVIEGAATIGDRALSKFNGVEKITLNLQTLNKIGSSAFVLTNNPEFIATGTGSDYKIEDGSLYEITDGKITGIVYMRPDGIQSKMDLSGWAITDVGTAFKGNTVLTSLRLPSTLQKISNNAFYGCTNLAGIMFAEGTEQLTVGENAFYGTALKTISFGEVNGIGSKAFHGCTNLESVSIEKFEGEIGKQAFINCRSLYEFVIKGSDGYSIGSEAFSGTGLGRTVNDYTFDIPDGATAIGFKAFSNTELTTVTIPKTVTSLGEVTQRTSNYNETVFSGCSKLTEIKVDPENSIYSAENGLLLSKDGKTVIMSPVGLSDVMVPSTVESVWDGVDGNGKAGVFFGTAVRTVDLSGSKITELNPYEFSFCTRLKSISFPSTMTSISAHAFEGCMYIEKIDLTGTALEKIGESAFKDTRITSASLPASLESIGTAAFRGCQGLREISFGENSQLKYIWGSAFTGCSSLQKLELPYGIQSLGMDNSYGEGASEKRKLINVSMGTLFKGCSSLSTIVIQENPANVTTEVRYVSSADGKAVFGMGYDKVKAESFGKDDKTGRLLDDNYEGTWGLIWVSPFATKVVLDSKTEFIQTDLSMCSSLASFDVDPKNKWFSVSGGILLSEKGKTLAKVPVAIKDGIVDVPGSVETITADAFPSNAQVDVLRWSGETLTVGQDAFRYCSVGKIELTSTGDIVFVSTNQKVRFQSLEVQCGGKLTIGDGSLRSSLDHSMSIVSKEMDVGAYVFAPGIQSLTVSVGSEGIEWQSMFSNTEYYSISDLKLTDKSGTCTDLVSLLTGGSIVKSDDTDKDFSIRVTAVSKKGVKFAVDSELGYACDDLTVKIGDNEIDPVKGVYSYALNTDVKVTIALKSETGTVTLTLDFDGSKETKTITKGRTFLQSQLDAFASGKAKDGYYLYGWYLDSSFSKAFTPSKIDTDTTLYAKWALEDGMAVRWYSASDSISALLNGKHLFNGEYVASGSSVDFVFASHADRELLCWKVDGKTIEDKSTEHTVTVTSDVSISTLERYTSLSNILNGVTKTAVDTNDLIQSWSYKCNIDASMSVWTGFPSEPLILDDYVYFRTGDRLVKLELEDGAIVKEVEIKGTTAKTFYLYLGYGGGYILDFQTGKAYDSDLNEAWTMPEGIISAFYTQGYFYGMTNKGILYKFDEGGLAKNGAWENGIATTWHGLYGTTAAPVFTDTHIYFIEAAGNDRAVSAVKLDDGTKTTLNLTSTIGGKYLDNGWLTSYVHNGVTYLFLTSYSTGLFDESSNGTNNEKAVLIFKVGNGGQLSIHSYINIEKSLGAGSAFIAYEGRGYVHFGGEFSGKDGGTLFVFDMDKILSNEMKKDEKFAPTAVEEEVDKNNEKPKRTAEQVKAQNKERGLLYYETSVYSHGSIVLNVGENGHRTIMLVPYTAGYNAAYFFDDYDGKTEASGYTVLKYKSDQFSSQAVRVGPNGEILWYTDSGTIRCYASASQVPYRFLMQDENSAEWVSQRGSDAKAALQMVLQERGWDPANLDSLYIYVKNMNGDAVAVKAADLTNSAVSGYREFLISTDISDLNDVPERTFYLYKEDGAVKEYDIWSLFNDCSIKGNLIIKMPSKILIHGGDVAVWIGLNSTDSLQSQIKSAMGTAGISFGDLSYNVFKYRSGNWEKVTDESAAISSGSNYFVSALVDDVNAIPNYTYYNVTEGGEVLKKTLKDLMGDSSLTGKFTTTPKYTVEFDIGNGTSSSNLVKTTVVDSGAEYPLPSIDEMNKAVTRNNYVVVGLLVNGQTVSGKIKITEDTVIEVSWAWKDESTRVAGVGMPADGVSAYMVYKGSGYGATSAAANAGITAIDGNGRSDVADKTLFVAISQNGFTGDKSIVGNLYCNGKVIYSEKLNNTGTVWYVTIGSSANSSNGAVLESLVNGCTTFVMEIEVDGIAAIRTVIDTSSSEDSQWVSGTPEICGYYVLKSEIAEGSTIAIDPVFYVLKDGKLQQGDVAQTAVSWTSSDESVAKISEGEVTAVSQGAAVITCTTEDGGYRFSCSVNVSPTPIKGVKIGWADGGSHGLNPGDQDQLVITYEAGAAKSITWSSSDQSIVYVGSSGKVKALSCGTAVIKAVVQDNAGSEPVTVEMDIEVSNKPVESISIDQTEITMHIGDNETLKATVAGDPTDPSVTWSISKGSSVTVRNGTVTAVSLGESTVRVSSNDDPTKYAECKVTVKAIEVETITVQSSLTLEVNKSAKLSAIVGPTDATDKSVAWSVISGSSVTVDQNGNVTALSEGTSKVQVSALDGSGTTAVCTVTVVNYSVKSIDMTSSAKLEVGKTVTLKAEVSPSNAKNKSVTWTSSNPSVATVSSGVVTAVSAGTAIITATSSADSSITATCVVTVTDSLSQVKSVTLDKTSLAMEAGSKVTVTATIDPEVTGAELVWTVSNGTGSVSVVKNSDGTATVTAKSAGSATLTVTVKGTQVSAACDITIASTETKVISEETKKNDDGTSTDTKVEEIDTGKGSTTTKTTETVKDTDGNVKGSTSTYEFTSDDPAIKTKTTVTVTEDANGNVGQPKVQVDMGNAGSSSNGTRSITVNADDLKEAIKQLDRAKVVTGIDDLDKNIEIQADEGKDVDQMVATLDATSISDLSSADGVSLSISSEMGRMQIGSDVFTTMKEQGGKAILSVKKSDDQTSVPDALSKVGQKTLYEVEMTVGGKSVHQLNGNVTLSLPFALSDGQDPSKVGVRYVDSDGNLSSETFRATYADGMVSFTTTHFSTFAVVYGDVASDSGKDTTTTTSGDGSSMASLCIVLAALTGAFAATTVMFVLRMKGKI